MDNHLVLCFYIMVYVILFPIIYYFVTIIDKLYIRHKEKNHELSNEPQQEEPKQTYIVVFVDKGKDINLICYALRYATVNYTLCKYIKYKSILIFGESKAVRVDVRIGDLVKVAGLHSDYVYYDNSLTGSFGGFNFIQQHKQTFHNEKIITTFESLIALIKQEVE